MSAGRTTRRMDSRDVKMVWFGSLGDVKMVRFWSLGRCQDGLVLFLGRCRDGRVLVPREMLRWSGFSPSGGAWSDSGNTGDVRGCVILF